MTVAGAWAWKFIPELASDTDLARCPRCELLSPLSEWRETEVSCEDCGEHPAMECPVCTDRFDHVRADEFLVTPVDSKGRLRHIEIDHRAAACFSPDAYYFEDSSHPADCPKCIKHRQLTDAAIGIK